MTLPEQPVPDTMFLATATCLCGKFLRPNLIETTMHQSKPTWWLTWRCPDEMQHDWKAANDYA